MPIKSIIMPHFQVFLALQIWFKIVEKPSILTKIINEHTRPSSEIEFRSSEKTCTDYLTFADWCLLFYIQVHSLSIPGCDSVGFH